MRDFHDQVIIAAHLFTEKLPVSDSSITALEERADQDGDHLLPFDSQTGAAKLNDTRKPVLGFQKIRTQAKEFRNVGYLARVVILSPLVNLLDLPGGF